MKKQYDEVDEEYEGFQEDHTSVKVMLLAQLVIWSVIFLVVGGCRDGEQQQGGIK